MADGAALRRAGAPGDRRRRAVLVAIVAGLGALGVALTAGCEKEADADVARVRIADRTFYLEVAATEPVRFKGLGGRTHVEPDGGMLFVFPEPQALSFVMRDCPIPIDILFLDGSGRVVAMHAMVPEEPRRAGEDDYAYNDRLKRYSSRFAAQFAVELKGGTLATMRVREGDLLDFDVAGLKARARRTDR